MPGSWCRCAIDKKFTKTIPLWTRGQIGYPQSMAGIYLEMNKLADMNIIDMDASRLRRNGAAREVEI